LIFYRSERISFGGCIISHSAAIPIAIGTVVNFKEAHVFEKLLRNFSKTCASKEFYLLPIAIGTGGDLTYETAPMSHDITVEALHAR
jgi:hypothetical protein